MDATAAQAAHGFADLAQVFEREWTKATVGFDCNTNRTSIKMKAFETPN